MYDVDSSSSKLKEHDFLGRMECSLGEIVGAPGSRIHKQLGDDKIGNGSIIACAEEVGNDKRVVTIQFNANKLDNKDTFGKSDPFLQIFRKNDDATETLIHRSEVIKNNLNPVWKPFKLPYRILTAGLDQRQLRIDVYDFDNDGGHDLIGSMEITVNALIASPHQPSKEYLLLNPKKASKKHYKNSGKLKLIQFSVAIEHTFLDYIRGGTQVHHTVAVDFTASNGNPVQPTSLHYIHPHYPNQYQIALKAVGEICQDYDSSKLFPALGFGGKLPNGQVSHEFFLNQHPTDPHCLGVQGIMEAYHRAIMSVTLYGPTNFAPIINHVAKFAAAASRDGSHYFVLLIITDGVISDLQQTKSAIIHASTLPMSIIIVGVGNDAFAAMDELDADKGLLQVNGKQAERDIVQFVPFRKFLRSDGNFSLSQAQLAKEVLREIPNQMTSWMHARGIKPKPPLTVDHNSQPAAQTQGVLQQPMISPGQVPQMHGTWPSPMAWAQVPPISGAQQPPIAGTQVPVASVGGYPPEMTAQYPSPEQQYAVYPGQVPVSPHNEQIAGAGAPPNPVVGHIGIGYQQPQENVPQQHAANPSYQNQPMYPTMQQMQYPQNPYPQNQPQYPQN